MLLKNEEGYLGYGSPWGVSGPSLTLGSSAQGSVLGRKGPTTSVSENQ